MAKKKGKTARMVMHSPNQQKAIAYCLNEGYKININPIDNIGNYRLEILRGDSLVENVLNQYDYTHYFKRIPPSKKELSVWEVIPMEYEKLYKQILKQEKMDLTLVYDTETTGLPGKKASFRDDDYPHLVQIAWIVVNELTGKIVDEVQYIIKPDGWTIPKEAEEVHRISTRRAKTEGKPLITVLNSFNVSLQKVNKIVAHNEAFDRGILQSSFYRAKMATTYSKKVIQCTMQSTYKWVNAPHTKENLEKWPFLKNKIKWCNMQELHTKLFSEGFEEAHDALVDVKALAKCYLELKRLKRL